MNRLVQAEWNIFKSIRTSYYGKVYFYFWGPGTSFSALARFPRLDSKGHRYAFLDIRPVVFRGFLGHFSVLSLIFDAASQLPPEGLVCENWGQKYCIFADFWLKIMSQELAT